ncbi:MAG: glycosyltransferase [Verrucomicrobia bacterium]|nr:glycosyltransferase [Verrucomicrobiota bacterium]
MNRILVGIPTLNEAKNVESMIERLLKVPFSMDFLFVDDHSDDGTGEILDRVASTQPRLTVLHRPRGGGIGSAHQSIIRYAYEHHYEVLVTMDCDFSHQPEDIHRLLATSETCPLVVGSRFLDDSSLSDWNIKRKFLTHLGHWLTRNLLHLPMDATGAFRVYRLRLIPRAVWDQVVSTGYAFFFESLVTLKRAGINGEEISIRLPKRVYGESKLNLLQAMKSLAVLARLYIASQGPSPSPNDVVGWDQYWRAGTSKGRNWYAVLASIYRHLFIARRLERQLGRHFQPCDRLYHVGCGGGEVDARAARIFRIVAVDISQEARRLYSRNHPDAEVRDGDILRESLSPPLAGIYSLGLVEHFSHEDIVKILTNMGKSIQPGGKALIFWPHRYAPSVFFLRWVSCLRGWLGIHDALHPPEPSLLRSRKEAEELVARAGWEIAEYGFGPSDLWIQAAIVLRPARVREEQEPGKSHSEKRVAIQKVSDH